MILETAQDYKLEIRDSQNLAENEEQRNFRLQRLRESQSIVIQAGTKQQRHYRSQIALACVAVVSVSFSQAGQARKTREGIGQKAPFCHCPRASFVLAPLG